MSVLELCLIAVGLSMDAFAVSICKGLSVEKIKLKHVLLAGIYFGGFQGLMPIIGWLLGVNFKSLIESIDHWIAFVLLLLIGISMIHEAYGKDEEQNDDFGFKTMLLLAIATSIDALAVGVTFAFLEVSILPSAGLIAIITFVLSGIGIWVGSIFGAKFKSKAEMAGGIILILIGLKILLEHLGIITITFF
ncbi:MAG: manganese efflux pump MntP family protein [Eubacterium sp.]|nr:manganese efflux pump MntP family protein [Eubacterium sp.]